VRRIIYFAAVKTSIVRVVNQWTDPNLHRAWVNAEKAQVEKVVNVSPKQKSIVHRICVVPSVGGDVGGIEHLLGRASRDCAAAFVGRQESLTERMLTATANDRSNDSLASIAFITWLPFTFEHLLATQDL